MHSASMYSLKTSGNSWFLRFFILKNFAVHTLFILPNFLLLWLLFKPMSSFYSRFSTRNITFIRRVSSCLHNWVAENLSMLPKWFSNVLNWNNEDKHRLKSVKFRMTRTKFLIFYICVASASLILGLGFHFLIFLMWIEFTNRCQCRDGCLTIRNIKITCEEAAHVGQKIPNERLSLCNSEM